ncbi:MAG: lipopolysaccharide heptosyltransferase II, partial [Planctomycetota bacterium]
MSSASPHPSASPPDPRESCFDASGVRKLLVVMPTWFGDCVMATPTLKALREACPEAEIVGLVAAPLVKLMDGAEGVDRWLPADSKTGVGWAERQAKAIRGEGFDACVLLPNSFRWAWAVWRAGVPTRIGYARDGRGALLTDRLVPRRVGARFLEVPTLEYYLQIARYLGVEGRDIRMRLPVDEAADRKARELLNAADGKPFVLLNPGAQKPEKRWPAERFAALADRCVEQLGMAVAVTGSPAERGIVDAVCDGAQGELLNLPALGVDLPTLKAVVRSAAVLVTNDTGPRHLAAAVDTPVVTLFGPTTPAWTEIDFPLERIVTARADASAGPITDITLDVVFAATAELLDAAQDTDMYAADHTLVSEGFVE